MRVIYDDSKISIGPGNTFGLYSCKEGLIKDEIKEISVYIRKSETEKFVYLMKKR